ncbi:hypothetical protein NKH18_40535 [Streptomyces sp. M10(2022)]
MGDHRAAPAVPRTRSPGASLAQGAASSQTYQLPEGTYLLTWTVLAGPKTKTFEVDCSKEEGHPAARTSGSPARRGRKARRAGRGFLLVGQ